MSSARTFSSTPPRFVVFTDLDGTLLDYEGYTWGPAAGAVRALRERNAEIILCSSKTEAEQRVHQDELGLDAPLIVENGSAVVVPHGYFPGPLATVEAGVLRRRANHDEIVLGVLRSTVLARLRRVREDTGLEFRGYVDMTLEEVQEMTGLGESAAGRARQRAFSETVRVEGGPEAWRAFLEALEAHGLRGFGSGPSGTVVGVRADKGVAVRLLTGVYRRWAARVGAAVAVPHTVGIGNAANDVPMLRAVDRAFLVERPRGGWVELDVRGLERVEGPGPVGWARAVETVLAEEPW